MNRSIVLESECLTIYVSVLRKILFLRIGQRRHSTCSIWAILRQSRHRVRIPEIWVCDIICLHIKSAHIFPANMCMIEDMRSQFHLFKW